MHIDQAVSIHIVFAGNTHVGCRGVQCREQLCPGQLWKGLFEQKHSPRNMRTAHTRSRYGIVAIHPPGRPDIFARRNDLRMDIECSTARTLRRTSGRKATDRMREGHIPVHAAYRKNIDRIGLDALRRIEHAVARSGIPTRKDIGNARCFDRVHQLHNKTAALNRIQLITPAPTVVDHMRYIR